MKEKEAAEYVESLRKYGSVPGLDNIRQLCERLDNPQDKLAFIHIAGTNGKGSVLAYLSTILQAARYRVGRFISPTIFDYRERIQVNGRPISKAGLCSCLERVREAAERMTDEGLPHPTLFEIETAAAFLYFLDKKCDIVVLETGLGGRLDATNVIGKSICSVFTPISMDHMAVLGDTLEEIALEKAGIMKDNGLVVTCRQEEAVGKVLCREAKAHHCRVITVEEELASQITYGLTKQRFSYKDRKKIEITMAGQYQIGNALLALEVIDAIGQEGFPVSEACLREGFRKTSWPGRFCVIDQKPLFLVDGAHNEDGAKRLAESIRFYFPGRRILYIMGVLADKEYDKIIRNTFFLAEHIITVTPPDNDRALGGYELAQTAREYHGSVTVADSLQEAVEMAYLLTGYDRKAVVIAFGSLSYLGRLIRIVEHRDWIRRDSHGRAEED